MSTKLLHAAFITAVIGLSFFLAKSTFFNLDYAVALSFLVFFIGKKIKALGSHRIFDASIMAFVIPSIVNSTGFVNSPLFFLLFFLLFALALLLEPVLSVTASLALTFFYIFFTNVQSFDQIIPLLAFPFLTPFALFLGQEFVKIRSLTMQNRLLHQSHTVFLKTLKSQVAFLEKEMNDFSGDHHRDALKRRIIEIQKLIHVYETSQ